MRVFHFTFLLFGTALFDFVYLQGIPSLFQTRKVFAVVYNENCDGKTYPVNTENFTFIRHGSTTFISGSLVISSEMESPLPGELRITKCDDRTDKNTCKHLNTFKWTDSCDFTKVPLLLGTFINKIEPPLGCPAKKARHSFRNVVVPVDSYAALMASTSDQALWILRVIVWKGKKEVLCLETGTRIGKARIRP